MLKRYSSTGSGSEFDALAERIARRGLWINLVIPFLLVGAVYLVREGGVGLDPPEQPSSYSLLLYVFIAMSIAEVGAAFVLRRVLFQPARFASLRGGRIELERAALRSATVVLVIGGSPILYGLILYLLGGSIGEVAYFGLLNLLTFRVLRPDAEFLAKALGDPGSI